MSAAGGTSGSARRYRDGIRSRDGASANDCDGGTGDGLVPHTPACHGTRGSAGRRRKRSGAAGQEFTGSGTNSVEAKHDLEHSEVRPGVNAESRISLTNDVIVRDKSLRPAVSSPDGVSTSGSGFAFSMFSDPAGTIPALTTDSTDGFPATVNVNLDGTTKPTDPSTETSVVPSAETPEPSFVLLLASGLAGLALRRRLNR
jgi:hypothetical protein